VDTAPDFASEKKLQKNLSQLLNAKQYAKYTSEIYL